MRKSILITGCSSGIGLCAARTLQQRGHLVVASVRKAKDLGVLKESGIEHVVQIDLASSQSINEGLHAALEITEGRLHALFNNAAYGQPGAIEDISRDTLRQQFEVNVFGTHELTVKAIPYLLKAQHPRIIQNSSILGFVAMPMRGAYNASKFALEGLSDTLRLEMSETDLRICLIEPGPIMSNFRKNSLVALEKNIDMQNSRHKERYHAALNRLKKAGATSKFTLEADAVVKKLIHALESTRPKTRYYVTFPTYLFAFLQHILPTRFIDKILVAAAKSES